MGYNPSRVPDISSVEELRRYLEEELGKISVAMNEQTAVDLRQVYRAPDRPREGMLVAADGTTWDPGSGAGVYEYVGGVWRRLNSAVNDSVTNAILANMVQATIKGRALAAGTGDPTDLTAAQAAAIIGSVGGALLSKVVNATYDLTTASGTQDITGFGFDPTAVAISYGVNGAPGWGAGYYAGGTQGSTSTESTAGTTTFRQTGQAIFYSDGALTNYQAGVVSLIAGGIRITWTKVGSPTGTLGLTVLGQR